MTKRTTLKRVISCPHFKFRIMVNRFLRDILTTHALLLLLQQLCMVFPSSSIFKKRKEKRNRRT